MPVFKPSITHLTGDVTADGPGSVPATVITVGTSSAANIHSAELAANAATSSNTASTIVKRDGSGNFSATSITSDLVGNASTATTALSFTGSLSGDVTGTQSATVVSFVGTSSAANVHSAELLANAATNANTASTIVKRDASGNFTASTITASLTGNATNITGNLAFAQSPSPQVTKSIYVDGGRTDTYTADGSILRPYKTIQPAITAAQGAGNVCIEVLCATYTENLTFNSLLLTSVQLRGHGSTLNPASGNAIDSSSNNDNLGILIFDGFTILKPINLVGSGSSNFLGSTGYFRNCAIQANVTIQGAGELDFERCYMTGNVTSTDVFELDFRDGPGLGGNLTLVNTYSQLDSFLIVGNVTVDVNSTFVLRRGTDCGSLGGSVTVNGVFAAYNSFIYSNIVINSGGAFYNGMSSWRGTLTVDPAGSYVNREADSLTALGDLMYGGASGIRKRLAGNTTATKKFLRQTGTGTVSATPAWDTIVAADIPLTSAHLLVGNGSNLATDVAASGDVSLANTGAFTIAAGAVDNSKVSASAAIAFSKLAALPSADILVGNGSNVATAVAVTGDIGLTNAGVATIANSAVTNAKVAAAAAIDFSKLAALTSGNILVGNGSNVAASVAVSGDISLSNAGVTAYAGTVPVAKATIATQAISSTAIDWATGNVFTKTLGASTTFTFSNKLTGQTIIVRLTNTVSNYTVTWPTVAWAGGTPPTMSPGAVSDVYTFIYDGTTVYGSYVQNMS